MLITNFFKMTKVIQGLCTLVFMILSSHSVSGQNLLAFPSAEGFGKYTVGGRGGKVYIVSNLNDSGSGSLREAVEAKGARTVVFTVSGIIQLNSTLVIKNDSITIAGQSAPGDGICITNYPTRIEASQVIIRYLRFRKGSLSFAGDAITGIRQSDIIIDHCSMSWGVDESASFYDNRRFTLQWSIISESLRGAFPHLSQKGTGYGGIWGGEHASFIYNLIAHHYSRTPRLNGKRYESGPDKELVELRNNVMYNWESNSVYGGESGFYHIINNYYKPGPATPTGNRRRRIINPLPPYGKFYVDGNVVSESPGLSRNNWAGEGSWSGGILLAEKKDIVKANVLFFTPLDQPISAEEAYKQVLKHSGASFRRDAVDKRVIREVKSGKAKYGTNGILSSEQDVVKENKLKSGNAPVDTDKDGIPDQWEKMNGLNPKDSLDSRKVKVGTHYTYLEVYLNGLLGEN